MVWSKALGLAIAETGGLVRPIPQRWRRTLSVAAFAAATIAFAIYADTSLFVAACVVLIGVSFLSLTVFTMLLVHHLLRLQFRIREIRVTTGMGVVVGVFLCWLIFALLLMLPVIGPQLGALLR
ncbi:hypothetical protein [Salinarimonas sp.]|uniref:hypothetical protein n=1 Tax=Salinarimonas sp. TaxID=2766526 RepID=UPI00391B8D1C